jgi:hypothetical protein
MSRIPGRDTVPERVVRSLLHRLGFRFSLRRKDLPGKPDIVFACSPRRRVRSWVLLASTRGVRERVDAKHAAFVLGEQA